MEKQNEILEKQIEHLNYNRNSLIDAMADANENSTNYSFKMQELRNQVSNIEIRIDDLMKRMVYQVEQLEDGSILKTE